jgi:hypothetical protein
MAVVVASRFLISRMQHRALHILSCVSTVVIGSIRVHWLGRSGSKRIVMSRVPLIIQKASDVDVMVGNTAKFFNKGIALKVPVERVAGTIICQSGYTVNRNGCWRAH